MPQSDGFEIRFSTDNAAFEDYEGEVARILRDVASKVERGSHSGPVRDINGNTIGSYFLAHQDIVENV